MTLSKAQAVAAAIIGAGFNVTARLQADGSWVVRGSSNTLNIAVAAANGLAVSQAVEGNIAEIEYR